MTVGFAAVRAARPHPGASGSRILQPFAASFEESAVPKPNYAFEKRQRELEKKRKKEEKAQRKQTRGQDGAPADGTDGTEAAPNATPAPTPGP